MDLQTTTGKTFTKFKVIPKQKELKKHKDEGKPILAYSSYMKAFPNW